MRTYWLLSEDDSRIQERFGDDISSQRSDVAPDLICNNTVEMPPSPSASSNTAKQPNQQMSQYLRQRARSSYHSEVDVPTSAAVSSVAQHGHNWASTFTTLLKQNEKLHSSTCMITHRYRHGSQPQVNGNILPSAHSFAKNAKATEAYMPSQIGATEGAHGNKMQPYLMGARNSNKVYYCDIEQSPRSAPQITFM